MLSLMIEYDTHQGQGGTLIFMGAGTHLGRDSVRAVGVRGEELGDGDERPLPPDSNLKGPAEMGVDIPWEWVRTWACLKNVSLESCSTLARGAFEDKARKRKMRNLTFSFISLKDTLEAVVGQGGGGGPRRPGRETGE